MYTSLTACNTELVYHYTTTFFYSITTHNIKVVNDYVHSRNIQGLMVKYSLVVVRIIDEIVETLGLVSCIVIVIIVD